MYPHTQPLYYEILFWEIAEVVALENLAPHKRLTEASGNYKCTLEELVIQSVHACFENMRETEYLRETSS